MKVDDAGPRLLEYPKETPRGVKESPPHVRLHGEAFLPHPLAERAQSRDRIDPRVVSLFPLQAAHLRDKRLGAAYLHAVYHVRNLHTGCLSLRQRGTLLSFVRRSEERRVGKEC